MVVERNCTVLEEGIMGKHGIVCTVLVEDIMGEEQICTVLLEGIMWEKQNCLFSFGRGHNE